MSKVEQRVATTTRRFGELQRTIELMRQKVPGFLVNNNLQLILFGGKGGVGKTTSAASTAVYIARQNPQKRILVVSTDPAHSLGDSLDYPIGGEITAIKGVDNLWGLEVDAPALMEAFREKHYRTMRKIAQRGTIMLERDINRILELTLPGLDEMIAIVGIVSSLEAGIYDLVILDTAPTGHTLRLLEMPAKMTRWAEVLDLMQEKHRFMTKVFGPDGKYRKDDADAFSRMIAKDITKVNKLLAKERLAEFVPVMIPEPMSIYETERLLAILKDLNISVRNIIVNRVAMKEDCPFCQSRQRDQENHLSEIERRFGRYNLIKMPLFPQEIRGIDALARYAEVLSGNAYQYRLAHPVEPAVEAPQATAKLSDLLEGGVQFLIFGGKGGVGKTSSAAATALTLARHNHDKKILIFSTDPAHSLADSFNQPIGDKVTQIEGVANLYTIEIDAQKIWKDFSQTYKTDIHNAFYSAMASKSSTDSGTDIMFDQDVMAELIDASPLGIDEVMALEKIVELRNEGVYDLIILDTAPTGHLIRFLELPERVRNWLKNLFQIFIRYKRIMPLSYFENINTRLIRLSRGVKGITNTLLNPQTTEFVAVTIPEAMGLLEMEDLLATLKKLKVPCRHIIINMLVPPTQCGFCTTKRQEQQRYVQQIEDTKSSEYLITEVGLFPHQVRGLDGLTKYAERIF